MKDLSAQAKIIRREGKILERDDKQIEAGFRTVMFVEWQGSEWLIRMVNGEVTRLKELWKVE